MRPADPVSQSPILVLAPIGRDAAEIGRILGRMGVTARVVKDLAVLCETLRPDGGAAVAGLVIAEEALSDGTDALVACLVRQPPWSDLPVVILTAGGRRRGSTGRWELFRGLGNVTLFDRPFHVEALQSAVRAALRARARQHETRRHLEALEVTAATLEARVEERTQALATETAEREAAQERLRQAQKMEALGQLAGGVAHDFNNASAAVLAGVALLEKRHSAALAAEGSGGLRLLAALRDGAERGAAVSRRLLAFARREALSATDLEPAELLAGMRDMLANALGPSIRVLVEASAGLPAIRADRRQLETVLINLAINARDAMAPGGGTVTFSAVPELITYGSLHPAGLAPGAYIRLHVADTGVGMDRATLARAMEPFFTTKPQDRGTGLGLSMAHGFATQSGGALSLESAPGQGTTVTLWLPQVDAEAALPAAVGETLRRALVVDAVPLTRRYFCHCIRELGWEAVELAEIEGIFGQLGTKIAFDLLLISHPMPSEPDSIDLAHRVWRQFPGLPVVIVVGSEASVEFVAHSHSEGLHVLRKPVSAVELGELVALLRSERAASR
jgi:signal transduction histidine kinase